MPTDLRSVLRWLNDMTAQVRHADARPSKDDLAVRAHLLAEDFPTEAFCRASFGYVVRGEDYWPSYEKMRSKLNSWWERNRPALPALLPPPAEPPMEDQLKAEGDALTEEDVLRSVAEIEALEGYAIRGALMVALKARTIRWAPRYAHLVPAVAPIEREMREASLLERQFEARHGRKMGEVTAEQLKALRMSSAATSRTP